MARLCTSHAGSSMDFGFLSIALGALSVAESDAVSLSDGDAAVGDHHRRPHCAWECLKS